NHVVSVAAGCIGATCVGVVFMLVSGHCFHDALRDLSSTRAVEKGRGMAVDVARERRELGTDPSKVQLRIGGAGWRCSGGLLYQLDVPWSASAIVVTDRLFRPFWGLLRSLFPRANALGCVLAPLRGLYSRKVRQTSQRPRAKNQRPITNRGFFTPSCLFARAGSCTSRVVHRACDKDTCRRPGIFSPTYQCARRRPVR